MVQIQPAAKPHASMLRFRGKSNSDEISIESEPQAVASGVSAADGERRSLPLAALSRNLKQVLQSELHDPWVLGTQNLTEVPAVECSDRRICVQMIWHVEDFPSELNGLSLPDCEIP